MDLYKLTVCGLVAYATYLMIKLSSNLV